MTKMQRRWLKRRRAIEPTIGHLKLDHRMDRRCLRGSTGDALHAALCAVGFNLRWLLRAELRGRFRSLSGALISVWVTLVPAVRTTLHLPPVSTALSLAR